MDVEARSSRIVLFKSEANIWTAYPIKYIVAFPSLNALLRIPKASWNKRKTCLSVKRELVPRITVTG